MACPLGRRDGPPSSTTTAAPTTQPTRTPRPVSKEIPAVTNRSNASAEHEYPSEPAPAAGQPRRRRGDDRDDGGEAGPAREAGAAQPVERVGDLDDAPCGIGCEPVQEVRDAARDRAGEHQREQVPDATVQQRVHEPAREEHDREDPAADDDDVDDPLRHRLEAAEELAGELDQRVAEQPLHQEHDEEHDDRDHQPQHVGRRPELPITPARALDHDRRRRCVDRLAHDPPEAARSRNIRELCHLGARVRR